MIKKYALIAMFVFAIVLPSLACDESAIESGDLAGVAVEANQTARETQNQIQEFYNICEEVSNSPYVLEFSEFVESTILPVLEAVPEADVQKYSRAVFTYTGSGGSQVRLTRSEVFRVLSEGKQILPGNGIAGECQQKYDPAICAVLSVFGK